MCILFGKLSKYEGKEEEEETTKDRHELFITKKKKYCEMKEERLSFLITNTIQYPKVPSCACFLLANNKKIFFYTIENLSLARERE